MYFVPEGQHDSSQARSAWSHEINGPVPAGRLNGSETAWTQFRRQTSLGLTSTVPPGRGASLKSQALFRVISQSFSSSSFSAVVRVVSAKRTSRRLPSPANAIPSWETALPTENEDDDEDDWEMTLNTYSCLAPIILSLRDKCHFAHPRLASSERLFLFAPGLGNVQTPGHAGQSKYRHAQTSTARCTLYLRPKNGWHQPIQQKRPRSELSRLETK